MMPWDALLTLVSEVFGLAADVYKTAQTDAEGAKKQAADAVLALQLYRSTAKTDKAKQQADIDAQAAQFPSGK